jgi:hypothetical protein
MPIYRLRNTQSEEEWEELMSISEMEQKIAAHPHVELLINGAPMVTGTMGKNAPMGKKKYLDSTSVSKTFLDSTSK